MAIKKSTTSAPAASAVKKADGFANVSILDANGVEHRFSVGIPLDVQRKLDRSLINAAKSNSELKLNASVTIWVAPDEQEQMEDIPFA